LAEPSWSVRSIRGTVAELLIATDDPEHLESGRRLLVCTPTDRALILGSSQPQPPAVPGLVAVHRRRSGGGAVWVEPGGLTWLELVLPGRDRLRSDDLSRSFDWLGRVMAQALVDLGHAPNVVDGPARPGPWGRTICFAGLGPGEVLVDERKVVGMSQRRTRRWSRFGVAVLHRDATDHYGATFAVPEGDLRTIRDGATTVPAAGLVDAVVGNLP
jgi:lipoate-protein ligase A